MVYIMRVNNIIVMFALIGTNGLTLPTEELGISKETEACVEVYESVNICVSLCSDITIGKRG